MSWFACAVLSEKSLICFLFHPCFFPYLALSLSLSCLLSPYLRRWWYITGEEENSSRELVICTSHISLLVLSLMFSISLDTFLSCNRKKESKKKNFSQLFFSLSSSSHHFLSLLPIPTAQSAENRSHETPSTPHCDSTRIVLVHFLYFTCSFDCFYFHLHILYRERERRRRRNVFDIAHVNR